MTAVTVSVIGVAASGGPRQFTLSLHDGATVRTLLDEVARRGGDAVRRALWREDGRIDRTVLVAIDGDVVDLTRLDVPLAGSGGAAEVSLFVIRPIFGG